MPRPRKTRYIEEVPPGRCFRPSKCRRPLRNATVLFVDEIEAVRLADIEKLTQEEAAARMKVSRATFARLITEAHRKIAEAVLSGNPIITEGEEQIMEKRIFKCGDCEHEWKLDFGAGCPSKCPECGSSNFHRTNCGSHYQRSGQCESDPHSHPHSHRQGQCCQK